MDIPEYEGLYQGSNFYKVKSLDHWINHLGSKRFVKGQLIKPRKNKKTGYLIINLCKDGKTKTVLLHRLMAELFTPNPENKPEVDHINRIRDDMKISNLRWVDRYTQVKNKDYEKIREAVANTGKRHSKPVIQLTLDYQFVAEYPSAAEASRQTGFNCSHISKCCKGVKYKMVGGYIWKYKKKSGLRKVRSLLGVPIVRLAEDLQQCS